MPVSVGDKLGPYEILALIGQGGMGEVYRARDPRLNRDVAIKVSAAQFSERFEREAKAIAALNRPNICQIYDVGPHYLVMEYIEGESPKGPMPINEALRIARQVADALEAAHEKGITHRDLKPGNIKIKPNGTVKVLDFGLAKVTRPASSGEKSPTLTMGMTQAGMILGTASYMSPEQARGKESVDKRADIWAFGVVLYELVSGKRLFEGEDVVEILAKVIRDEPDLSDVPTELTPLLKWCLQKDPKKRLRDIGDIELLLANASIPASSKTRSRLGRLLGIAALLFAVVAAALGIKLYRATRPTEFELKPLVRLDVNLGQNAVPGVAVTIAISPDGRRIVFPMRDSDGKQQLATRLLDQTQATVLPGTGGASDPFFSPDGQWVGFFANSKMKKISVLGGAPVTLCDSPSGRGASWGEDGNIIAALNNAVGLSRVPASGGNPQPVTKVELGEATHGWPQVLPGGKAIVFTSSRANVTYVDGTVEAFSPKTGVRKTLMTSAYFGRYLPTNGSTGHLIYIHDETLFAVPFDSDSLELHGTPAPLLEDVAALVTMGAAQFDFSRTGTFVYRNGRVADQTWPVVWMDDSGKTQPLVTKPNGYTSPRFSPDGGLLALGLGASGAREFQIVDWQRGTMSRLVFTTQQNFYPIWSPDGKHLAFRSATPTGSLIRWTRADGSGPPVPLLETKETAIPYSFSPDGRLAYHDSGPDTGTDLWTLPLDLHDPDHPRPGKPEPFLQTPFNEQAPRFSPNGRWIAYQSDETGRFEVYVRPFRGRVERQQVSTSGGTRPVWSRDGQELFFEGLDNRIMVATCTIKADSFVTLKPRLWSETRIRDLGGVMNYDLARDGKRLAVIPLPEPAADDKGSAHVTFLLNFFDEVARRVPVGK